MTCKHQRLEITTTETLVRTYHRDRTSEGDWSPWDDNVAASIDSVDDILCLDCDEDLTNDKEVLGSIRW